MHTTVVPRRAVRLPRLPEDMRHALWVPAYLLCFFLAETLPSGNRWATQLPADRLIPYCSLFLVPYVLWYGYLALTGVYLLRHDREAFQRYLCFLSVTCLISIVCFLLLPSRQDLRPAAPDGLFGPAVALLYRIDTPTNVFPSGHVMGSLAAALAVWDALWPRNRRACLAAWTLSALICAATLFLKQHTILDVLGGFAFSLFAAVPVYRRRRGRRETRADAAGKS